MANRSSGKKRSNRGWWWVHFTGHPGYANKKDTSTVSGKAKVTCTAIYGQHVAREQQLNQKHISTRQRDSPRDLSAITGARMSRILNQSMSY
ncbi:hypothetical protein PAXRUDRAFT_142332 [Paxillus rubicundulus Ve08.2h10]|uniref:Unplaced genomic scaffold scaffold_268, whole genome shotgun sequence n=1 Tax=Paxillus rubicundulus Ve08.2h10 TaxID=930991 RepID=A0A0D0DQJ0_9AGAM|nr:hypothetical protein PAXRUDRAFT_142332 [Paxillus rubicundulus Ve08.2h10]